MLIDGAVPATKTECKPTTQMENQASYMAGHLLFGVLGFPYLQLLLMKNV